jgi:hypothetical protein
MGFAYEFSSVSFHQWIFISGFSSVGSHLWVFICGFSSVEISRPQNGVFCIRSSGWWEPMLSMGLVGVFRELVLGRAGPY